MDNVNKPIHYRMVMSNGTIIESVDLVKKHLGDFGVGYWYLGNILKYLFRAEKKNKLEDYRKARVYLNWLIDNKDFCENVFLGSCIEEFMTNNCGFTLSEFVSELGVDLKIDLTFLLYYVFKNIFKGNYIQALSLLDRFIANYEV